MLYPFEISDNILYFGKTDKIFSLEIPMKYYLLEIPAK